MAHPEALLLSAMINSGDVLAPEEQGITPAYFHEWKIEYEWLTSYNLRYGTQPSWSAFHAQFPDFVLFDHQDIKYGCEQVRESHLRHQLGRLARNLTGNLKSETPGQVLSDVQSEIMTILSGYDTGKVMTNSVVDYHSSLDYALLREMEETPPGIPFVHPSLRNRAYGQVGGDVTVFAARLNQGKSWTLVNEAARAVLAGRRVMYYSLEMSKRQMEYRFQTIFARHFGYKITHSMLHKGSGLDLREYKEFLTDAAEKITGSLFINDTSRGLVTPTTVAGSMQKMDPELVIIDHITLMGASSGGRSTDGWNTVAEITGDLKHVSTSFDVPIMTASQINREGDTAGWKPPATKNLAQSDSIGQDADNVITMKRFSKSVMVYSLEKCRSSEAGLYWWSRYDPEHGDFSEITRDEAEAIKTREDFENDDH
jgi:replicative DNA helicase